MTLSWCIAYNAWCDDVQSRSRRWAVIQVQASVARSGSSAATWRRCATVSVNSTTFWRHSSHVSHDVTLYTLLLMSRLLSTIVHESRTKWHKGKTTPDKMPLFYFFAREKCRYVREYLASILERIKLFKHHCIVIPQGRCSLQNVSLMPGIVYRLIQSFFRPWNHSNDQYKLWISPVTAPALPSVVLVLDVYCVYFLVMMFVCFYSWPILWLGFISLYFVCI